MRKTAGRFAAGDPASKRPAILPWPFPLSWVNHGRTPSPDRCGYALAAQPKPRDDRLVARVVARLQIIEKPAAL
jgi:hypothetical protein